MMLAQPVTEPQDPGKALTLVPAYLPVCKPSLQSLLEGTPCAPSSHLQALVPAIVVHPLQWMVSWSDWQSIEHEARSSRAQCWGTLPGTSSGLTSFPPRGVMDEGGRRDHCSGETHSCPDCHLSPPTTPLPAEPVQGLSPAWRLPPLSLFQRPEKWVTLLPEVSASG